MSTYPPDLSIPVSTSSSLPPDQVLQSATPITEGRGITDTKPPLPPPARNKKASSTPVFAPPTLPPPRHKTMNSQSSSFDGKRTDTSRDVFGKGPAKDDEVEGELVGDELEGDSLDVISYWGIGAAGWLLILLLPLLLFPRFLLFLSQSPSQPHISLSESFAASSSKLPSSRSSAREGHYDDLTGLEHFLCTQMGIGLLAVMGMCLLLIPTPPRPTSFPPLDPTTNVPIPFTTSQPLNLRMPFLLILSSLMGLSAFMSWNSSGTAEAIGGGLGGVVALGNGAVAIWGWWVAVFGTSQKYLSKKTGADKRTSQFPFYNKNAASVQKAAWKRSQKSQ